MLSFYNFYVLRERRAMPSGGLRSGEKLLEVCRKDIKNIV